MTEVVYLIEATVYDPALPGTRVLRYCNGQGYVHEGNYYEPRIKHPGRLKRLLFSEGKTGGPGQIGFGEVVLVNTDGALDALTTYGFDGRQLMIKRGLALGALLSGVVLLAACGMEQATSTWDEVAIRIKDRKQELNVPLQTNKYGGTNALPNGVDGTSDIQGKPKPLLFGAVKNATPVCVNTSRLIYQLHDGGLAAISRVYDKGIPLSAGAVYTSQAEMEATAPLAGQYQVWLAGGMFRLGSTPAGLVTADASEGTAEIDRSAANLAQRLANKALDAGDIAVADVSALHTLNPAIVGYYTNSEATVATALDEVLGSIGGWYGFDATGQLHMGRLDAPAGDPVATLTEAELLSIERLPTSDEGRGLPAWRVNLNYDRNWSPAASGWATPMQVAEWQLVTLPASLRWQSIAYGNGIFVAIAKSSSNLATTIYATSPDGITWTQRSFPYNQAYSSIAFGSGRFVVTYSGMGVYTSTDGLTWSVIPFDPVVLSSGNCPIIYANGAFMIPGSLSGSSFTITSPDGITWTATNTSFPVGPIRRIDYGAGYYIASGDNGLAVSADNGVTWAVPTFEAGIVFPSGIWSGGAIWTGSEWVAMSTSGYQIGSADALTWYKSATEFKSSGFALFQGVGYFLVPTGYTANAPALWSYSPDGLNWLTKLFPGGNHYTRLATDGSVLVAIKVGGTAATNIAYLLDVASANSKATWLTKQTKSVTATDAAIQTIHPLARELNIDTLIVNKAEAQAEANRLLTLHKADRARLKVKVPRAQLPADLLGKPVRLQVPRYDYGAGKLLLVIGVEEDCAADTLLLDLWG